MMGVPEPRPGIRPTDREAEGGPTMLAALMTLMLMDSPLADIGPAPDVALIDAAGRPFRLADLRGKAVLVSFVYTTCTGSCPATTQTLSRVQQTLREAGLWGRRIEFVSISLD